MESFDLLLSTLSALIGALAGALPTFFYFRQEKKKRELENTASDIQNIATQSDEWRKLYLESQDDSRKKDQKIDELRSEIRDLNKRLIDLERRVRLNSIYRCDIMQCPNRIPPITAEAERAAQVPDGLDQRPL